SQVNITSYATLSKSLIIVVVALGVSNASIEEVLLQNPSKSHVENYEEMVKCPTINWISEALKAIGLSLDVVPVLDICVLFSDRDLANMDEETKERAIEAAYALTEKILRILRPRIIICCQCMTRGTFD